MSTSLRDQLLKAGLVDKRQVAEVERLQQLKERRPESQRGPGHGHGRGPGHGHGRGQEGHGRAANSAQQARAHRPAGGPKAAASRPSGANPSGADNLPAAKSTAPAPLSQAVPVPNAAALQSLSARMARDQALNRRKHEKAQKKARLAEIKQLIERHRLPSREEGEPFNFIDGNKIRRILVDAALREQLKSGAILIVRHEARYDLVPAATAARIRERDADCVIGAPVGAGTPEGAAQMDEAYAGYAVPDDLIW